jgi:ABC-type transporter MlaC component
MTFCHTKKPAACIILIRGLCIFLFTAPQIYSSVKTITISDHKEEEAAKFIKDLVNEALEIVNQNDISDEQKRHRLSEYINRFLDIDRAAQAVFAHLGYKDLSPTDQK